MRRAILAAALAVLAAACNESRIDPGAAVVVGGTVLRQDGSPVAGARVALMKEADAGDVFAGVVSIGLSCLEYEFSECAETRAATTDGAGSFRYDLKGEDTQGRFGNASVMEVSTAVARGDSHLSGAAVSTRFQVQAERVALGIRAWEPALRVDGTGAGVRVEHGDPPGDVFGPTANLAAMERWVVFEAAAGAPVWRATARGPAVEFDARVLEDTRGGVSAYATVGDIKVPPDSGTDVEVLARSPVFGYASPAGAPPSRGKPCGDGPCVLTDGRFDAAFVPECPDAGCEPDRAESVTLDLGSAMPVTLVVLRGCDDGCTVEGSTDGTGWQAIGTASSDERSHDVVVAPRSAVHARFVRVGGDVAMRLREVSVWDDRPVVVSGSLLVSPQDASGTGRLPGPAGGTPGGRWPLLAVAVAVAVAATGAALVLRRRRRATAAG